MSKIEKLINKIMLGNSDKNINFSELIRLLLYLEFTERIKGSHHIFTRNDIEEILNIQPLKDGHAKPYQVKQVRNIILKYNLLENFN